MKAAEGQPTTSLLATLEAARQALMAETVAGRGGLTAVAAYSRALDTIVERAFKNAPPATRRVAVVALGGYGRRHLCLHSDVDLLVLVDGRVGTEEERFVRALLQPLWDLHLTLGHQVRELTDFDALETDNPEFLLALLDARLVAGDAGPFDHMLMQFHQPATHAWIVDALEALIGARHAQFNDTLYQLEPDIKDAPGSLRDLLALRALARLTDPALLVSGPSNVTTLSDAEDFLLRIRSILHLKSRRNHNIVTHELQEKAAQLLGFEGAHPQQRVEGLMSAYFRHARAVSRMLEWVRRAAPRPVGPNIVRSRDGIRFVDGQRAAREPATWLALFQAAIDTSSPVGDEALALIQQHVSRYEAADFFSSAESCAAFLHFLKPEPGLYLRLTEMHDCGLLGQMVPEFKKITCRVVRDFYHKYTVDEHTLLTIRNIERLLTPATPSRARFGSLLQDLHQPELLTLALLFHDTGKWREDEHVSESLHLVRHMFERLALAPASRDTVEFLIREHIQMSLVAFRRDTEDPDVVKRFAALVGTEERLKLLCLLTVADVGAVSPETLTPWREELLWRLYVDTYNHLTQRYGDERIAEDQSGLEDLLRHRPAELDAKEISRFVEGLPSRYLQLFSRDAIYQHVRLSRNIEPDHIHASLEPRDNTWELTVVTLDKPYLFSNICGVLSTFGMDILRGHALTNPNGLVLDMFQFTDDEFFLAKNPDGRARLLKVLEQAISGRSDVTARLRARERGVLSRRGIPRFAPVIHCDNQASHRYTILDIIANNQIGLLHRISRVISRHGCDVDLVLISTEGEKAIDVFHIRQKGAKLADDAERELVADLERTLEETDEAH